jgi:hypothetical protein
MGGNKKKRARAGTASGANAAEASGSNTAPSKIPPPFEGVPNPTPLKGCSTDVSGPQRDTFYKVQGATLDPAFLLELQASLLFADKRLVEKMVGDEEDEEEDANETVFETLVNDFNTRAKEDLDEIEV